MALLSSGQQHLDTSPVFLAAWKGHWQLVGAMIEKGLKVNQEDGEDSLLELAIAQDEEFWIIVLLRSGVDVDYRSRSRGRTPLMHAVTRGKISTVDLLLRKGAAANAQDTFGSTPLLEAITQDDSDLVDILLQHGADRNLRDKRGYTPIILAARLGRTAIMQRLLDPPTLSSNLTQSDARSLLMSVIARGQIETLNLLLGNGFDVNSQDSFGTTPLHKAVIQGHIGAVKALIDHGADVLSADKHGNTPLLLASGYGKVQIVRRLLRAENIDLECCDISGRTPLLKAVAVGQEGVVDLLLSKSAKTTSRDKNGDTPLLLAAGFGDIYMVRRLLEARDIDLETRDRDGRTPLLRAACNCCDELIDLLIDSGADTSCIDNFGFTALSLAISNPEARNAISLLLRKAKTPGVFLRQGAKVGHPKTVEVLLKAGSPLDDCDEEGRTPLWWAACCGHERIVELLLETGRVNANAKDIHGQTPLKMAAERNHGRIIRTLVRAGADRNIKDASGRDPRWWQRAFNSRPARGLPRLSKTKKRRIRAQ
ncbi:hypothetical protein HIM_12262 [Hirsutella minnesotensis 3608]|uniref:Uncharacterized protein n=1 Tax=Hirsutella minnesotensis 3608 TaxID=1043627 RepID=A0A0F7ZF14_9HYPO|nr:hypothetical protein HIM_12262 [Hirsutella minnesotensis 3608]